MCVDWKTGGLPGTERYILGIGAANIDMMGRSALPLVMEDSNPGTIGTSVGGVTHNVCANAARLGLKVKLITALGSDLHAGEIRRDCLEMGIDPSHSMVVPGHGSSVYLSLHNDMGEMALAVSDMRVLQHLTVDFLEEKRPVLQGAGAIMMDSGLPESILTYVTKTYGERIPVFVDPVSCTYARKLSGDLTGYHTIKPNRFELEELSGMSLSAGLETACGALLERGVARAVVSLGREGCFSLDRSGAAVRVRGEPLDSIANATGAGDAFMGGLLYALVHDLDPEETLLFASGVARLALQHPHTINPNVSAQAAWDEAEKGRLRAERVYVSI
jgi:pseudouridine kinase